MSTIISNQSLTHALKTITNRRRQNQSWSVKASKATTPTWTFLKMTLETESMEVAEEKKVGKEELTVQFTSEKGWENSWNEKSYHQTGMINFMQFKIEPSRRDPFRTLHIGQKCDQRQVEDFAGCLQEFYWQWRWGGWGDSWPTLPIFHQRSRDHLRHSGLC